MRFLIIVVTISLYAEPAARARRPLRSIVAAAWRQLHLPALGGRRAMQAQATQIYSEWQTQRQLQPQPRAAMSALSALQRSLMNQAKPPSPAALRVALAGVARDVAADMNSRLAEIDRGLAAADPKTLYWTAKIVASDGSDWGYIGLAHAAAEIKGALQVLQRADQALARLEHARPELLWLQQAQGDRHDTGWDKTLADKRKELSRAQNSLVETARGIRAGQLAEMMRLDELGRSTAVTLDGVRQVLQVKPTP